MNITWLLAGGWGGGGGLKSILQWQNGREMEFHCFEMIALNQSHAVECVKK